MKKLFNLRFWPLYGLVGAAQASAPSREVAICNSAPCHGLGLLTGLSMGL
jgi:hypothetical protein